MLNYKNILGKNITQQQFSQLEEYIIETIDETSGNIKITETVKKHRGSKIKKYEYFLEPDEDKNTILQQFFTTDLFNGLVIYFNKVIAFDYTVYDVEQYGKTGQLGFRSKRVYDNLNRLVMSCLFDLQTNEILTFHTPVKYYYGNENDVQYLESILQGYTEIPELKLVFNYEFNETTNEFETFILDINDTLGEFKTMNVQKFIEKIGSTFWNAHAYYHSLYPLIPESTVV